jgi:hypothetical protein
VFSALFDAIFSTVPEDYQPATQREVRGSLERLLAHSRCDATFVACLQRIACGDSSSEESNRAAYLDLTLPPALIGDTSYKSLNFHTGILLLEKQILQVNDYWQIIRILKEIFQPNI